MVSKLETPDGHHYPRDWQTEHIATRKIKRFKKRMALRRFQKMSRPRSIPSGPALIPPIDIPKGILRDWKIFRTVYQREGQLQIDDFKQEPIHT